MHTITKPNPVDRDRAAMLFVANELNPKGSWHKTIADVIQAADATRPALKRWIEEGMEIETMQVTLQFPTEANELEQVTLSSAWVPGARIVDHVGATFATFNGSYRYFNELRTITATKDTFVGIGKEYHGRVDLIAYRVLS